MPTMREFCRLIGFSIKEWSNFHEDDRAGWMTLAGIRQVLHVRHEEWVIGDWAAPLFSAFVRYTPFDSETDVDAKFEALENEVFTSNEGSAAV